MKRILTFSVAAMLLMGGVMVAVGDDQVADTEAKALFVDQKCNSCHAVSKAGIERKGGAAQNSKVPDLSTVGATHDAGWITKYLKKEETLNGKKHTMPFKGTDDQLKTVSTWLASLKADKTGAQPKEGEKKAEDTTKSGSK